MHFKFLMRTKSRFIESIYSVNIMIYGSLNNNRVTKEKTDDKIIYSLNLFLFMNSVLQQNFKLELREAIKIYNVKYCEIKKIMR